MYKKAFYIAVEPVGSKFAKALQQGLGAICNNVIYRVSPTRAEQVKRKGRSCFQITQRGLNKIEQLRIFRDAEIACPGFALSIEEARNLNAKTLFARTLINSTNGRGIVEFERCDAHYPNAPLYTEYIPKKAEYRVHVFGEEVIDTQQKKKKRGFEGERDTRIRNVNNGYVYTRGNIVIPEGMHELAIKAVRALNYSYGAVDVIYNEKQNKCYVLEVNSRPGLMGTTKENYCKALVNMFKLETK